MVNPVWLKDKPPPDPKELWKDAALSTATGTRSGLESIFGGMGDVGGMQQGLAAYAAEKLGLDPDTARMLTKYSSPLSLFPSSEDIGGATDRQLSWLSPELQEATRHEATTPGGQLLDVGSNLASGALSGPEALFTKLPMLKGGMSLAMAAIPAARRGGRIAEDAISAGRNELTSLVGKGTQGLSSPLPLSGGRISQRFPKEGAKGWEGKENPLTENLLINTDVLRHDPVKLQQASDIIGRYPTTTKAMMEMNAPERVEAFKRAVSENFGALYDLMTPEQQQRASQWYWGANRIANERAAEIGIHPNASAGMYAALSPQKDWFQNVYLGDQVGRILSRDPKVSGDMMRKAQTLPVYTEPEAAEMLRALEGRRISNMTPDEQALAVRLYEETHGPVGSNTGERVYRKVTPEGDYGDVVLTQSGEPRRPAWGSFGEIKKSILAAQSGGDPSVISPLMGEKHKVRNFYNDIVNPGEAETFGDITVDTHQIGAGLFSPLTGKSEEVAHGLGSSPGKGIPGAPQSAVTGLQGLYPLYADATRQAAAERGVPVIAMQSTPWEALRALFPPEFRTAKNQSAIANIWREQGAGNITAEEARRRIIDYAGGFQAPSW